MSGSLVNLSLLARGVGEVKRNGHEKVDVIFEPEDYFNWAENPAKQYLPPVKPKYNAFGTPRANGNAVHMPKTYITRKGALLLFSEDLAIRTEQEEKARRKGKKLTQSNENIGLRTVEDLAKSILCYGNNKENSINLRFVQSNNKWMVTRNIRPGFSARRYLSRLTRSFDDSFLDKLQTKGYISDKTFFQTSDILPHVHRRINDDLSYMPSPYRIMRQMLIAPGLLSGYSFYRMATESEGLTEITEEETGDGGTKPKSGKSVIIIGVRDEEAGQEVRRAVSYSDLSQEEKQNVLTDLLVKSTISHALQKQREIIEESISESNKSNKASEPIDVEKPEEGEVADAHSKKTSVGDFNFGDALKTYIEEHVDIANIPADRSSEATQSFKAGKVKTWSGKSRSSTKSWPDQEAEKEYISGVPVASFKDGSSGQSPHSLHSSTERLHVVIPHALSPIKDVSEQSLIASRETTFNKTPLLPPILKEDTDGTVPEWQVRSPTPQNSNLTQVGSTPVMTSREPTLEQQREQTIVEEAEDKAWGTDINEADILKKAMVEEEERRKEEAIERKKQKELQKRSSQGSALSSDDKESADKSRIGSQASKKGDPSPRGSLIWAPGGEVISIGGTLDRPKKKKVPTATLR